MNRSAAFKLLLWGALPVVGWASGWSLRRWSGKGVPAVQPVTVLSIGQSREPTLPDSEAIKPVPLPETLRRRLVLAAGAGDVDGCALSLEGLKLLGRDPVQEIRTAWLASSEEVRLMFLSALTRIYPAEATPFFLEVALAEAAQDGKHETALASAAIAGLFAAPGSAPVAETLFESTLGRKSWDDWLAAATQKYLGEKEFIFSDSFTRKRFLAPLAESSSDPLTIHKSALYDASWFVAAHHILEKEKGPQHEEFLSRSLDGLERLVSVVDRADKDTALRAADFWYTLFCRPMPLDPSRRAALAESLERILDRIPASRDAVAQMLVSILMVQCQEEGEEALVRLGESRNPALRRSAIDTMMQYLSDAEKLPGVNQLMESSRRESDPQTRGSLLGNALLLAPPSNVGPVLAETLRILGDPGTPVEERRGLYSRLMSLPPSGEWDPDTLRILAAALEKGGDPGPFPLAETCARLLAGGAQSPHGEAILTEIYPRLPLVLRKTVLLQAGRANQASVLDALEKIEGDAVFKEAIRFIRRQLSSLPQMSGGLVPESFGIGRVE